MSFWKEMFKKGEIPEISYKDQTLGEMIWSEDEESWVGRFNEVNFWIAYEMESKPKVETLRYASRILLDNSWLSELLILIKQKAKELYSKNYEEEIDRLKFVTFSFHNDNNISIHFYEGNEQPWWFAEIEGRELKSVGFDT